MKLQVEIDIIRKCVECSEPMHLILMTKHEEGDKITWQCFNCGYSYDEIGHFSFKSKRTENEKDTGKDLYDRILEHMHGDKTRSYARFCANCKRDLRNQIINKINYGKIKIQCACGNEIYLEQYLLYSNY